VRTRAFLLIKFWTLVSFFFFSCSKFIQKKEKKPESFSIYLPLAEDYPILKNTLESVIKEKFPKAKVQLRDYLSSNYVMAPFDEWFMKANQNGFLQLVIHVPEWEERDSLVAFLKQNSSKLLFSHSIPPLVSPQKEPRVSRGEGYFCRMTFETKDILEQQLCRELVSLLCPTNLGSSPKNSKQIYESYRSAPKCSLKFTLPLKENQEKKANAKDILLASFPLPLKVKNDYPFERFTDIEESAIIALFKE
jgi:hypothetical protein